MIAVVGSPTFMPASAPGAPGGAGGLAAGIALAAAAGGAEVQLVGKIGDDPSGDAVLLALARGGVGHLAVLRDAGHATPIAAPRAPEVEPADSEPIAALLAGDDGTEAGETAAGAFGASGTANPHAAGLTLDPADIALGLRYVRDFLVLVAAGPLDEPSTLVLAEAATFADATLIVIAKSGDASAVAPRSAIVLEAPETDPDAAFAALVGRLAVAVERGVAPADAFRAATAEGGWERATG